MGAARPHRVAHDRHMELQKELTNRIGALIRAFLTMHGHQIEISGRRARVRLFSQHLRHHFEHRREAVVKNHLVRMRGR